MNYGWPTDVTASVFIALSGYLLDTGYFSVQQPLDIRISYPDELTYITKTTIAVNYEQTPDTLQPLQLGLLGWKYNLNINIDLFTKTDRNVDILLYEISKFTIEPIKYYSWGTAIISGLAAGDSNNLIYFDFVRTQRDRLDFNKDEYISNDLFRHRGKARFVASFYSDVLI